MWYNQHLINAKQYKIITCKRIEDIALQKWYTDISISPMCTLYRFFLKHLKFEKYIDIVYRCYRISLCINLSIFKESRQLYIKLTSTQDQIDQNLRNYLVHQIKGLLLDLRNLLI